MKRVFSNHGEVMHRWAHQSQPDARAGNVRFEGARLYSYQTCIAEIVEIDGARAAVFTSHRFSPTTAGHLAQARRAAGHLPCFVVARDRYGNPDCRPESADALQKLAEITSFYAKAKRATREYRPTYYRHTAGLVEGLRKFCAFFGFPFPEIPEEIASAISPDGIAKAEADREAARRELSSPKAEARREKARAARTRAKAQKEAEKREAMRAQLDAWREGKTHHLPFGVPMALRCVWRDGKPIVETSWRASVRLREALVLFALCRKQREQGREVCPDGVKVGVYRLTRICADGSAQVGCHFLPFDEMQRLHNALTPEQLSAARAGEDAA